MLRSKSGEIERLERQNAALQKADADQQRRITKKTEKIHRLQRDLYKEQEREQETFQKSIERQARQGRVRQAENLRVVGLRVASLPDNVDYDAFISHASEDKEDVARPLAVALRLRGLRIWYDEFELRVGDSLRRSIDAGLARSRFGIVILSPAFFANNWPQYELDGLVAKEISGGKVILPLWHKVSKDEVLHYSPTLADKVALNTSTFSIEELAEELATAIKLAHGSTD